MNYFSIAIHQSRNSINRSQICGLFCLVFLAGCGQPGSTPVKVNIAQQTLISTMDCWKEGRSPEDLRDGKPSIVVSEAEWNDESKLIDYEIVDETPAGPNLNARVKLKLSKAGGKEIEKTVTYVVGTSPALTVFRNVMK